MNGFTRAFRSVVAQAPDRVAMREGALAITYGELAARAGGYRDACRARGLRRGQVVVLQGRRGIETTAAMIGVLLAGGAYTVIGPDYPAHRLAGMHAALDVAFVADDGFRAGAGQPSPDGDVVRAGEDLMYVIFTSGTAGAPKAVGIPDRAVLRLLAERRLGFAPGLRISHLSPIEFDASVMELWGGLLSGMEVRVVAPAQLLDPAFMFDFISHQVDVMWLTSSLFNFLVEKRPIAFAGPRRVVVGGEALSLHHVNMALPYVTVVNGYGPTENTVFTTLDVMEGPSVAEICIGTAVAGTQTAILGADGTLAERGELLAFGDGLATGYINDSEKTVESFVRVDGRRAYRTGDQVSLRPDGRLVYQGRLDSQVKVNGFRVDLQEIEGAFLACGSGHAKAFVHEGRIVVAVTHARKDLRSLVSAYLPRYMQPASVLQVANIPLTPNGKADVRALMQMTQRGGDPSSSPQRDLVRTMIGELVGHQAVPDLREPGPPDDNLFDLGLTSLLLWKLVARINVRTGADLSLAEVLCDPTVAALERAIARAGASARPTADQPSTLTGTRVS
jgi:amino acid adenylation domain-containing protein